MTLLPSSQLGVNIDLHKVPSKCNGKFLHMLFPNYLNHYGGITQSLLWQRDKNLNPTLGTKINVEESNFMWFSIWQFKIKWVPHYIKLTLIEGDVKPS
jgi:hypothetical protein